jgi:hypothetical protein
MGQPMGAAMGQPMGAAMGQPMGAPMGQPMGVQPGQQPVGFQPTGGGTPGGRNLIASVVSGEGFDEPRKYGLYLSGGGAALVVLNLVLAYGLNRFYPYLSFIAPPIALSGAFMLATGEPLARGDGQKAPMWTRAGLGGALAVGAVVGIIFTKFLWIG